MGVIILTAHTITAPMFLCLMFAAVVKNSESVTVSVFILSGAALKASVQLEGPVAPKEVSSGADLQLNMDRFHRGERVGSVMSYETMVDFENLEDSPIVEDEDEEPMVMQVLEDDADLNVLDNETEAQQQKREEKRRERREQYHQRLLEARKKREEKLIQRRQEQQQKLQKPEEGKPFEYTTQVKQGGWYRFCVKGTWYQVSCHTYICIYISYKSITHSCVLDAC